MTKHLKSRAPERKRIEVSQSTSQCPPHNSYPSTRHDQLARKINHFTTTPISTQKYVSRNLPGPLHGHPEQLRQPSRRFRQRHGHRQPLSHLPVRRVLCPCSPEAWRPDSLQGLRSPCVVQGADQAVRISFRGITMRYARDTS